MRFKFPVDAITQVQQRCANGTVVCHGAFFGSDNNVHATWNVHLLFSKGLANKPFPSVPNYRVANLLADRQTQSRALLIVSNRANHKHSVTTIVLAAINRIELALAA